MLVRDEGLCLEDKNGVLDHDEVLVDTADGGRVKVKLPKPASPALGVRSVHVASKLARGFAAPPPTRMRRPSASAGPGDFELDNLLLGKKRSDSLLSERAELCSDTVQLRLRLLLQLLRMLLRRLRAHNDGLELLGLERLLG